MQLALIIHSPLKEHLPWANFSKCLGFFSRGKIIMTEIGPMKSLTKIMLWKLAEKKIKINLQH